MDLARQILDILDTTSEDDEMYDEVYCKINKHNDFYEISFGAMYTSPKLSFSKLLRLSELFGTEKIDVDDYSNIGCESCDYGSDYGNNIQIYNPTKNVKELEKLVGKDLYE